MKKLKNTLNTLAKNVKALIWGSQTIEDLLISLKEAARAIQKKGDISYLDIKLEIDTYPIPPKQPSQASC
eukprot:snap_masked-scaffold_10-processed-gene-6.9-mRNA-1 protein AED:1.00 eAED:1.00 QI:0/0/0/0/1/1/2/0/69